MANRCCGPITAFKELTVRVSTATSTGAAPASSLRKGLHRAIDSYSAFQENDKATPTGLAGYLRERGFRRLFIAGLATDFCVAWTALDAVAEGFGAVLVEDACRAIDLDGSLAAAMEAMTRAGVTITRSAAIAG